MRNYAQKANIKLISLLAALVICVPAGLFGCSPATGISFTVDTLDLAVGDTRDLRYYAVYSPVTAEDKRFSLSTDGECIAIAGTSVMAIKPGKAVVKATAAGGSADIEITVTYRDVANLILYHDGPLVMTPDGEAEHVLFSVALDDNVDPDTAVVWTVNGVGTESGRSFDFVPPGYGEYTVEVNAGELYASETVAVYRPTSATAYFSGELIQQRSFSPVHFYAREDIDTRNPRSSYSWRVNGEEMSTDAEFDCTPLAFGDYEVELYLNGVKRKIGGSDSITVSASGARAPVGEVVIDGADVYVVWPDGSAARSITVTAPDGSRNVYNSFDARYTYRFYDGLFVATELIDPFAVAPGEYSVVINADAPGETFTFMQYPIAAKPYAEAAPFIVSTFLTDIDGALEWIRDVYALGQINATAYMSRELKAVSAAACDAIRAEAALLGMQGTFTVDGDLIKAELEGYVKRPTANTEVASLKLFTTVPHFESYDSKTQRGNKYVFSSDRIKDTVAVSDSEQLLRAVMGGRKPAPAANSAAEYIYGRAKSALLSIIGEDYTDRQKAHAIHDWLQFATDRVAAAGAASSANYIDGVFGNGELAPGAVTSRGIAKTFALMCAIEGIDVDILSQDVAGDVYSWNKVCLDGLWYNVDAYGGEIAYTANSETLSHSRLFISDARVALFGLTPYGPAAYDEGGAAYLDKSVTPSYCDMYIDAAETAEDYVYAAVARGLDACNVEAFSAWTPVGKYAPNIDSVGAEFIIDGSLDAAARAALESRMIAATVRYFTDNYEKHVSASDIRLTYCDAVILTVSKNIIK